MGVCVLWVTDENSCLNPSRLDTLLHREAFEVEQDILEEGHELLSKSDNYEDYAARLKDYVEKVTVSKPYYVSVGNREISNCNRLVTCGVCERGRALLTDDRYPTLRRSLGLYTFWQT
jgi:hypothetical protein